MISREEMQEVANYLIKNVVPPENRSVFDGVKMMPHYLVYDSGEGMPLLSVVFGGERYVLDVNSMKLWKESEFSEFAYKARDFVKPLRKSIEEKSRS